MLCQNCGKNEATTFVRSVVNGVSNEQHLCSECAQKAGFQNFFGDMRMNFGPLLSNFFDMNLDNMGFSHGFELPIQAERTYTEPKRSTMPNKTPYNLSRGADWPDEIIPKKETPLEEKQRELKNAISSENYERAAVLRDEIKQMEENI